MKSKTNILVKDNLGRRVISDMILGQDGPYASASVLDANAVSELIDEVSNAIPDISSTQEVTQLNTRVLTLEGDVSSIKTLIDADESEVANTIDKFQEIVSFLDGLDTDDVLYTIIQSHVSSSNVKNIVVLSESDYNNLQEKDANTEYNIIEL